MGREQQPSAWWNSKTGSRRLSGGVGGGEGWVGRGVTQRHESVSEGSEQATRAREVLTDDGGEIGEGGREKNPA